MSHILPLTAEEIEKRLLKAASKIYSAEYVASDSLIQVVADATHLIEDGSELKFRSPVSCTEITKLRVQYAEVSEDGSSRTNTKIFAFADANGNDIGEVDNLFAENAVVKVILDFETALEGNGAAFVQNANTNEYLEDRFLELENKVSDPEQLNELKQQVSDLQQYVDDKFANGSGPSLELGETATTAYRGDLGAKAYEHSQTQGNPHGTSKLDLGLDKVDNTADAEKSVKYATQAAKDAKGNEFTSTYATKVELNEESTLAANTYATKDELIENSNLVANTYATKDELADNKYENATTSKDGLMSAADKATLEDLKNSVSNSVKHTISQTDITAGTTPLATGELYLVYE